MSKDVMHGMVIWPFLKSLPESLGHSFSHSSKVFVPSDLLKTYMGFMKDVVGAATVADTAVAASAPRAKEARAARTTCLRLDFLAWRSGSSAAGTVL